MRPRWIFAATLMLAGCREPQGKSEDLNAGAGATLETVLGWLPADTESIIVAAPFQVPKAGEVRGEPSAGLELQFLTVGAFFTPGRDWPVKPGPLREAIGGARLQVGLLAARRFRFPNSLGSVLFEGCSIAIFEDPAGASKPWESVKGMGKVRLKATSQETFVFEETLEGVKWTFYICRPRKDVLLCATHEGYLKEVLDRMGGAGRGSFAEELKRRQEWKRVDRETSSVWAIRIFRPENAGWDPVSPRSEHNQVGFPHDSDAEGAAFSLSRDEKRLSSWYVTGAKDAIGMGKLFWMPDPSMRGQVELQAPGVVHFEFDLPQPGEPWLVFLLVLFMTGHAVVI